MLELEKSTDRIVKQKTNQIYYKKQGKNENMKKNEVYTVVTALESVTFHLEITVLGAEMDLGRQHHLYIGLFGCQNFRLCHCCGS